MSNKYLEKVALMISPAKTIGAVASQARRVEGKAVRQQLAGRAAGASSDRLKQIGKRRMDAGLVRVNAEQMSKS